MNRHPVKSIPALYTSIMPEMIEVAKACGYALGVHGSMSHDLDLIAAPWVWNAFPPRTLVERIAAYVGGFIADRGAYIMSPSPEPKVHGRTGFSIYFNKRFTGPYIDISVMPRVTSEGVVIPAEEVIGE